MGCCCYRKIAPTPFTCCITPSVRLEGKTTITLSFSALGMTYKLAFSQSPIFGDSIYPHPHPGPCTAVGILGRFPLSDWNEKFENSRSVISAMNHINKIYDLMFTDDMADPLPTSTEGAFPTLSDITHRLSFPRLDSCPFLCPEAIETFQRNQKKLDVRIPFFTPRLLLHACSISFTENYLPRELTIPEDMVDPVAHRKELKELIKPLGEKKKVYSSKAPF